MAIEPPQKQINIRVDPAMYRALKTIARLDRRSIAQASRLLMEEGVGRRMGGKSLSDDISGSEIAAMAMAGGAFDWFADEPELYDDTCGEPT